jgi:hypothetical protein
VIQGPASNPTFPAGFSPFDPPVTNAQPVAGTPAIAEWTRQNQPGDTMALTGENFSLAVSDGEEGADTRFVFYDQGSGGVVDGLIQRLDDRMCALTLPKSLPADDMYLMWPQNKNGPGTPVAINRTDAWWIGPNQVTRGKSFAVYGRNLVLGNGPCHLYISELNRWLTSSDDNPYKAAFSLPSDIAAGTYTFWVHNGHGGKYGWSKPLSVSVADAYSWNGNVYNVTSYGAKGDGSTDDFNAISAAVSAANSDPGSTLYFPAGTYLLTKNISFGNGKKIVGEGIGATIIKAHPTYSGNTSLPMIDFGSDSVVSNLEMRVQTQNNFERFTNCKGERDTLFVSCKWTGEDNSGTPRTLIETGGSKRIDFVNCTFVIAGDIYLAGADYIRFEDCIFLGMRDANILLSLGPGATGIDVNNSFAGNLDESDLSSGYGWCKGRFIYSRGSVSHCYFGENTTSNMLPRLDPNMGRHAPGQPDQNSGEQIMMEWLICTYRGVPASATSTTVTFDALTPSATPSSISIVSGKGFGQSRRIASIAGNTVTVEEPFTVAPDTSSMISLGTAVNHMVAYENYFDGRPRGPEEISTGERNASAGVEVYGAGFNVVVDGNTCHELNTGTGSWNYGDHGISSSFSTAHPNYFNLYQNNTFDYCYRGTLDWFATYDSYVGAEPMIMGNVYRRNTASRILGIAYGNTASDSFITALEIYDNNTAENTSVGASVRGGKNLVWKDNHFSGNGTNVGFENQVLQASVMRGNKFDNFTSKFGGTLPAAKLEVPIRVVYARSTNSIPVWNGGATPLTWSVSSDSAWLVPTTSNGFVQDQLDSDVVSFSVSGEPASGSEAVVTLSSDSGQTKQVTVVYDTYSAPPPPDGPPAPVLTGITVSGPANVDEQTTVQYTCTANWSDDTTTIETADWTVAPSYAQISNSGLLSAGDVTEDQSVTVTASFGGMTESVTVTIIYVPVVITGITITGPDSLDEQTSAQYTCTASWSDGTFTTVSPDWTVAPSYAQISSSGVLSADDVTADQSVTVTASFGGLSDTHTVTINYIPPVMTAISISGPVSVDEGDTAQYTCAASWSDGTVTTVSPNWTVAPSYAQISSSGLLSAGDVTADQSITVTASFGGLSDTHTVTINYIPPVLTDISISGPVSVDEGDTAQYTCTASWSDGTFTTVSPSWTVSSSYAQISSSGLLSAGDVSNDQSVTITASFGGLSDTHSVTISYVAPPVEVTGISISGPTELDENSTAAFNCTVSYSDGTTAQVNPVWSQDASFASINSSGILTVGNIDSDSMMSVSASYQGFADSQVVTVGAVGTRVVYPLTGFGGKLVRGRLWDEVSQEYTYFDEIENPDELVIENVNSNQWYWIVVEEYDEALADWVRVQANWINM